MLGFLQTERLQHGAARLVNSRLAKKTFIKPYSRMNEPNNTPPSIGERPIQMSEQISSRQLLPEENAMRTGDRTCTQKLTIPSLEKHESSSANLWCQTSVQYLKMTKNLDLSTMTNSTQFLLQYREH